MPNDTNVGASHVTSLHTRPNEDLSQAPWTITTPTSHQSNIANADVKASGIEIGAKCRPWKMRVQHSTVWPSHMRVAWWFIRRLLPVQDLVCRQECQVCCKAFRRRPDHRRMMKWRLGAIDRVPILPYYSFIYVEIVVEHSLFEIISNFVAVDEITDILSIGTLHWPNPECLLLSYCKFTWRRILQFRSYTGND